MVDLSSSGGLTGALTESSAARQDTDGEMRSSETRISQDVKQWQANKSSQAKFISIAHLNVS